MAQVEDSHISVRFRHGIHTFYLFVDPSAPFSQISNELVTLLEDRYPNGLTTALDPAKETALSDASRLAYAVLTVPNDPSRGWKRLNIGQAGAVTPSKCGVKDNGVIAFTFLAEDDDDNDDDVLFEVEWPKEDDEVYE